MSTLRFYKYGMLCLVILNVVLIYFLMLGSRQSNIPPHRPPGNAHSSPFFDIAIDILELEKEQLDNFEILANKHAEEVKKIMSQQKKMVNTYFNSISNPVSDQELQMELDSISYFDTKKITLTLDHFKEVKEILNQDQQKNFDRFVARAIDNLIGKEHSGPPHLRNK